MVSEDAVYQALGNVIEPGLAETVRGPGTDLSRAFAVTMVASESR